MEAEDEIPRCRTLLCAVQTGGKYFGKLLQNMCENTVQRTFYNVLDENIYKHDILHLWKNDKCCLCGVSTVHHYAGSLKQKQILSVYSAIDRKCGRIFCKFCPCSYKAKEGVCTSNIDITFSYALLSRVFLKSVHPSLPNVRRAIDEIKEIRNTAVHCPETPLHRVDFDKEWLNLKSSLLIICKYLKESTDMLEEEMEKFHYLVNTCKDCSFRIKASLERMKYGELNDSNDNGIVGNPFQMFAVCQACDRIQKGCKDAQSLIFDNLHLFMGLTPYEFLPDLEEAGALTEEEVRHIKSLDKRAKQMEAFLSILKERGISSCRKTLDILAEKDYGPAIREMRKEKKAGCEITFAVNGNFDIEEVNALKQKTTDHTTEHSSGIGKYDLRLSVLGPQKDKIEKILKDFIESEDFSSKLKDIGPEDISVTNGSIIVHLAFKCQEDYDKFSVAVSEGKLFDIASQMWDEVKCNHQIDKQDANMIVYIQNVSGRLADSGETECSAAFFIDTNNEFLTEELCPGTLIKYLKESHHDISEAIRIRKEHPFDRRAQSQELLKFLRNGSFEFIQKCILATQPETIKRKLEESMSSVHAVLETEDKEKETMVEDTLLQTGTDAIIREKHSVLETEDKEKETMVEDTLLQTGTDAIIREKTMASSDSREEYHCQVCRDELNDRKARCVCFECEEFLCKICSQWHLNFKTSKDHNLLDLTPFKEKWKQTALAPTEKEFIMNLKLSPETTLYRPALVQKEKKKEIKATKCSEFSVSTTTEFIGVSILEEHIVVFDINNLNLFDCHGEFITSVSSKAETRCITPVKDTSFATSGYGNRVYLWNVQGKSIVPESITYKVDHVAHGIDFNGKYFSILHSVNNSIQVLDQDGERVNKISIEEAFEKKITFGWDLHMDRETNNIYLPIDKDDGVLCLSMKGEVLWLIPLNSVSGITEMHGALCVSDVENACMHLITKKGEYTRKLLDETILKGRPRSVTFAENNRLYVTFEAPVCRRNTIIIFAIAYEY